MIATALLLELAALALAFAAGFVVGSWLERQRRKP